ncbi:MAG: hypothetical protein IJY22_03365 [Clostridia bacterium]|nr:hypothetical protein [Clostridia bacterium]
MEETKKPLDGVKKPKSVKAPMSKNKKRLIAVIVSVSVILLALIATLIVVSVVGNMPPELSALRPRIEALVNASYDLNDVIWGEGLPTYPRAYMQDIVATPIGCDCHAAYQKEIDPENAPGQMYLNYYHLVVQDATLGEVIVYQSFFRYMESEDATVYTYADAETHKVFTGEITEKYRYATRQKTAREGEEPLYYSEESGYFYYPLQVDYDFRDGIYKDENDPESGYDYVREDCGYVSVEQIKAKAEMIYSAAYRAKFYPTHFDGQTTPTGVVQGARYRDFDNPDDADSAGSLIKSTNYTALDTSTRFLFDTMTMHEDSSANWVKVEIDYYKESDGSTGRTTLCFALENGQWYLDCPSF